MQSYTVPRAPKRPSSTGALALSQPRAGPRISPRASGERSLEEVAMDLLLNEPGPWALPLLIAVVTEPVDSFDWQSTLFPGIPGPAGDAIRDAVPGVVPAP